MSLKRKNTEEESVEEELVSEEAEEDDENFEVEAILDERVFRGQREYFVKWKRYPDSDNTWEPAANMKCPDLLADFNAKKASGSTASSKVKNRELSAPNRSTTERSSSARATPVRASNSEVASAVASDNIVANTEEEPDDISDEFVICDKDDHPFAKNYTADSILCFILMGEQRFAAITFKEQYTPFLIDVEIAKLYIMEIILVANLTVPTYRMTPREDNDDADDQENDVPMEHA